MTLLGKNFEEVAGADLQRLIAEGVTEGQGIEFKRDVWGRGDEDIREMLRDISSMANAYGGYMLVGIDEDAEGRAAAIHTVPNLSEERDRIFGSCIANLQPRIIGLDIREVDGVLVIKIPNSLNLHQITYKGLYQFWVRHDRQKTKMSVDEIKEAFLRNASGLKQSNKLTEDRLRAVQARGVSTLLITATPLRLESELFEINNQPLRGLLQDLPGGRYGGWDFNTMSFQTRPSLNGLTLGDPRLGFQLELYRNGYFEARITLQESRHYKVATTGQEVPEGTKILWGAAVVEYTYNFLRRLKAIMNILGYAGPYAISLNLLNIPTFALAKFRSNAIFGEYQQWDDQHVPIGPLVYESINPGVIAKELCDRFWQAFGFEGEPYFQDGAPKFE